MTERRPWSADQSENALLSIALRDPTVVDEALQLRLEPEDFGAFQRRILWEGMVTDRRKGIGPDEATVLERHERNIGPGRPFKDFSELAHVVRNLGRVPSRRENLESYLDSMRESRSRRVYWRAAQRISAQWEEGEPSSEMQEAVEEALSRAQRRSAEGGLVLASDLFRGAVERSQRVRRGEETDNQLFTGLEGLDSVLRLHPGHYGITAGRPGMGKTQLALTQAIGIAKRHGPVLFNSVEMGRESLGTRLYKSITQEVLRDLPPNLDPEDLEEVEAHALSVMDSIPLIIDTRSRTLPEVLASWRVAKRKHGICAAFLDYLQKTKLPSQHSREQEIAQASEALSHEAGRLGILASVLSQLNRGVDSRKDRRPLASDLRESGSLEQDADSIVFVYRDSVYNRRSKAPEKAELIIEKQRNGRAHVTVPAYFKPGDGFFRDWKRRPSAGSDFPGTWTDDL